MSYGCLKVLHLFTVLEHILAMLVPPVCEVVCGAWASVDFLFLWLWRSVHQLCILSAIDFELDDFVKYADFVKMDDVIDRIFKDDWLLLEVFV